MSKDQVTVTANYGWDLTIGNDIVIGVQTKTPANGNDRALFQFHSTTPNKHYTYVEVKIVNSNTNTPVVAIGFGPATNFQGKGMVGWFESSIGYHADDGHMFQGKSPTKVKAPLATVTIGDTFGIGFEEGVIFFTKNGTKLRLPETQAAITYSEKEFSAFVPTISSKFSEGTVVQINSKPVYKSPTQPVSKEKSPSELLTCVLCEKAQRRVAFFPITHFITCEFCSKSVAKCPICSGVIGDKRLITL